MGSGDRGTLAQRSRAALAEGGVLATQIPGFAPRPSQQDFAVAVADALDRQGMLLAEAGPGTGKTFAYLVPALLSGLKTKDRKSVGEGRRVSVSVGLGCCRVMK